MAPDAKMTIVKRTILWLAAITAIWFIMITYVILQVRDTVREEGLERIRNVLDHKIESIRTYVEARDGALGSLVQLFAFASMHHPVLAHGFWDNEAPKSLREGLEQFVYQNGFYDIFLISPEGDIVFTVQHESDLHTNLNAGRYRNTQLARVFKDALQNAKPYISEFEYYEPSHDYAAFMAEPILKNGKIIGIAAAQIDSYGIEAAISDYRELGKTGEVLTGIMRNGKLMNMTGSRWGDIRPYTYHAFPSTFPLRDAARGEYGQRYGKDRMGHNVAMAWGWQKELGWGIAVKIDEHELLDIWYNLAISLAVLLVNGVFVVGFMVTLAFRSFMGPIQELTYKAMLLSRGEYDIEINREKYDREWQSLIGAFLEMASQIKEKIGQLNVQNEMLTVQKNEITALNLTLEGRIEAKSRKLQEYIDIVDKNVITSQTDAEGKIIYVSDAFCKISGYPKEELIGKSHRIVRHPDMPQKLFKELWETITSGRVWHGEVKNKKADGGYYWVDMTISPNFDSGKIIGYTSIRQDITYQKMVEELAITDGLTGLYNRRHYTQIIRDEMNRVKRHGLSMALMMIDVDHFKRYNDTYGHQAGDEVLTRVAEVMKHYTSRSGEYAFRLGGEEFAIIVSEMDEKGYYALGERIRSDVEKLSLEHSSNDAVPWVTISIGIAVFYGDLNQSCEDLYRQADTQLYRAKEGGRNRVCMA